MPSTYGVGNYGEKVYSGPNPVLASANVSVSLVEFANAVYQASGEGQAGLAVVAEEYSGASVWKQPRASVALLTAQECATTMDFGLKGRVMLTFDYDVVSWLVKVWYASSTAALVVDYAVETAHEMQSYPDPVVTLFSVAPFSPYTGRYWDPEEIDGDWTPEVDTLSIWVPEVIKPWSYTNG